MEEKPLSIDWEDLALLTPKEAAAFLGVPMNRIMTLAAGWSIPVFRISGNMRFETRELITFAEVEKSSELLSLARVKRARQRTILMLDQRLPFDSLETEQNRFNFMSKHVPQKIKESLQALPPRTRELRQLLLPDEVAKQLKISKMTLTRILHSGKLSHYKVGRLIRIDPTDLELYLASVRYEVWVR